MRRMLISALVTLAPTLAHGQGAVVETLGELRSAAEPPEFRAALPARADVPSVPPPREQGATSTCVSWSVTYAAASQAARRNGLGASVVLSPAYSYNQVSGDRTCHSPSSISRTLELLREHGALPIEEFAFDAGWCGRLPNDAERRRAARYRIKGWSRFDASDIEAVKAQLARGVPVLFSMRIGTKLRGHRGDSVLDSDAGDFAGHAMVAVGYDNARNAFRIQNSWGRNWGDGGYGWFSYEFWKRNVRVGFVID